MKTISSQWIIGLALMLGMAPLCSARDAIPVEAQVDQFFDQYISTYNRRFGNPGGEAAFRAEIVEYLNIPLLQAPPNRSPMMVESAERVGRNFAGFVAQLEQKGVERLQWQEKRLKVLSPTQVLASNVGHGVDADGNTVYETVSIYLVYKIEGRWKIISLSPYQVQNKVALIK